MPGLIRHPVRVRFGNKIPETPVARSPILQDLCSCKSVRRSFAPSRGGGIHVMPDLIRHPGRVRFGNKIPETPVARSPISQYLCSCKSVRQSFAPSPGAAPGPPDGMGSKAPTDGESGCRDAGHQERARPTRHAGLDPASRRTPLRREDLTSTARPHAPLAPKGFLVADSVGMTCLIRHARSGSRDAGHRAARTSAGCSTASRTASRARRGAWRPFPYARTGSAAASSFRARPHRRTPAAGHCPLCPDPSPG